MPDDYVVRRRGIGSEMMMINRGFCKLYKPSTNTKAEDEGASMSSLMHSIHQTEPMDFDEVSEYEDDSSDGFSSDSEGQKFINAAMFGSSSSKRWSKDSVGVYANTSDSTDVRRFRSAHQRRLSYPEGAEKKAKTYHEYMHPGQAFGEMSLLMNYKRTANIRAITFVEMCVLNRIDFQNIISRYPEDRRRVLLSMLEKCIETKVIPFPWESIIKAAMSKRRTSGKKDITRANVVATMTAKEAACILVEAIDINTPDESIKYGFQNSDQKFVADSLLRRANSIDAKINDKLNRRRGSVRLEKSYTHHDFRSEENEESTANLVAEASSGNSDRTLQSLAILVQNLADNVKALQQEVRDLSKRSQGVADVKRVPNVPLLVLRNSRPSSFLLLELWITKLKFPGKRHLLQLPDRQY
ncbi:hypothetical protein V7S43_011807 [Phytophthora oleae]|uniref:Cyclic nucleotide-binding domain-containing protein n=1 Tax=Phytophthora oleae TaxID=2107226 RepID=A0ABD3FAD5_9STRA